MFDSKLKIGVQPMYSVGCLKWLLEIHRHNIIPGIVYTPKSSDTHYLTEHEWSNFFEQTNEIIIGCNVGTFRNVDFHKWLLRFKPKYLEIYNSSKTFNMPLIGEGKNDKLIFSLLRNIGNKSYIKGINNTEPIITGQYMDKLDAVNVKNFKAAGSRSEHTLEQSINWAKLKFNKPVIASGGMSDKQDIDEAFGYGADAVLLGTVFACAEESNLSTEAKQLMVSKSSKDIVALGPAGRMGLTAGKWEEQGDDDNLSNNLQKFVKSGKDGILYSGHSLDKIKSILPIKDIVQKIVSK